ncbi:DUF4062 domain-containing protein [Rhizobium leguminosarum bv. viciae]|uniref:DUF4062 domain-containing protein n=1 Tax=Rhizobium leguminosarum TaxID=384 RepID=UPI0014416640|nr:DUF4062 domain-containing protein [Rhizobium leguminosarum]NKK00004.1 DUF4062 domain-containing protein [Rhizobium leguminosarum bv. viciae]NKK82977.1 DUF4062 domain-containing protein [Rhizobium leguminosarum bv. viciae]
MSDRLKIIRVFIGSPGGLDEEREAAHQVVASVNRSHSERWGLLLRLMGWENAVPGYVRPQSKINEDLDRCDYFIGVLWNKWGSRPSVEPDGYTSGFEEEYFRAQARIEDGQMKDMAIYFKEVEVPDGCEPGEDIRKVLAFRQKCIDEKKNFFKGFSDLYAFRDVVREKLEEIGWRETEVSSQVSVELDEAKRTPKADENTNETLASDAWLLDEEARRFLKGFTQRSPEWESTLPHEVARLRLMGTAVTRGGNDNSYLGNHDANLMFENFKDAALSNQEVRALVDCGVVGFQHQNVPLWGWLAKLEDERGIWRRIELLAGAGATDTEKKNAIDILKLGGQGIPSFNDVLDKKAMLGIWLDDTTSGQVFDAAVAHLLSNANKDDLPLIEEVGGRCSPHRRTKIEEAIVGILSRTSLDAALKRLVEKQVDKVDGALVDALFESPQSLSTTTVLSCLSAKSESVRLRAVKLLFERNEIKLDAAETLLTDSNHEIRLLAAESLIKQCRALRDDVAKKALRIIKPSNGLLAFSSREQTDDTYYDKYVVNRLAELDFAALKAKAQNAGPYDNAPLSVLYSKYPSKVVEEIRENLRDLFKGYFVKKVIEAEPLDAATEKKALAVYPLIRKPLCVDALAALCHVGKAQDLDLVRMVIEKLELDATDATLDYLARFGDWSDIERIKKMGSYSKTRPTLLGMLDVKLPSQKASTIFALGKGRLADLLALDLDSSIRIALAKRLPNKVLLSLKDELLLRELGRDDDRYRSIFALRCVQTLSKARVSSLMDKLFDSERRFYNSVHWLDLGAAFPSRLAKKIADRALSEF